MNPLHDFDPATGYCKDCGQGYANILRDRAYVCKGGGNLIAISHLRAWQRVKDALGLPKRRSVR